MGILLSDKDMESAYGGELPSYEDARSIAKAQLKKVLREAKTEDLSWKFRQALLKETGLLEK